MLIKVTQLSGEDIYININYVAHFIKHGEGTAMVSINNITYYIKESINTVKDIIRKMEDFNNTGRILFS